MTPKDIVRAALVPVCWGLGYTMAKPAIDHFPPLFMVGLTYLANFLVINALWPSRQLTPHWHVMLITSCVVTIQAGLGFYGYRHVSASLAVLVVQVQVPIAVLFGWWLLKEELSLARAIGIAVAFGGVALVVGLPTHQPPWLPVTLLIIGAGVWAFGQVLVKKLSRDAGLPLLRAISLHAVPQCLLASLLLEGGQWQAIQTANPLQWAGFLTFSVVGFFCGYVLWYSVLSRNRIDEVTPFVLLMPVVGVFAAVLVLGEALIAPNLIGGAIVILGVAIVSGLRLPHWLWPKLLRR
jgi:O-acetylserine/cysteine efflux transporter